jgi:hypothetical protein
MHIIYIVVILTYLPASHQVVSDGMTYMPFDTYEECMQVIDGAQRQMNQLRESPVNAGMYCLGLDVTDTPSEE